MKTLKHVPHWTLEPISTSFPLIWHFISSSFFFLHGVTMVDQAPQHHHHHNHQQPQQSKQKEKAEYGCSMENILHSKETHALIATWKGGLSHNTERPTERITLRWRTVEDPESRRREEHYWYRGRPRSISPPGGD